jgi:hypothetical protein
MKFPCAGLLDAQNSDTPAGIPEVSSPAVYSLIIATHGLLANMRSDAPTNT